MATERLQLVGGIGGIKIESATVGQTIKVKAVDENGKPTEWESADFPEELPVVELTTPVDMGTQFTAEENAVLTAAVSLGKPVIVKCTIMETPDMTIVMNNYANMEFISIFADLNITLANMEGAWVAIVNEIQEGRFTSIDERVASLEETINSMPTYLTVATEEEATDTEAIPINDGQVIVVTGE